MLYPSLLPFKPHCNNLAQRKALKKSQISSVETETSAWGIDSRILCSGSDQLYKNVIWILRFIYSDRSVYKLGVKIPGKTKPGQFHGGSNNSLIEGEHYMNSTGSTCLLCCLDSHCLKTTSRTDLSAKPDNRTTKNVI